mmetsp:Transcript_908/g.2302  ORF Transcript_908/g.2302 Transcript_908/m.2302 type:complete len:365 (+) Transcript_908:132-1226(+)|eukprot:CAMPEP_0172370820 /NCGR_PEP_ID=MMETSP1060-20121228/39868_1 /TAXON_ID=37318 /ORGANISM="Pseudo-nitzschia pungens, Strain cf. cingulata" /LENGTH=364 /DNA_ID=CAMNT_0013096243 /DNA_START=117 /DNA_END=1211 /DNA_ORIENTATION=-
MELPSGMASFVRPALILLCAMVLFNLPTLMYKIGMFLRGVLYLLFCNDKSWKLPQCPSLVFDPILRREKEGSLSGRVVERKTIYFVRHGESTWNDTFNKGSHRSQAAFAIGFVPGLIKSICFELYLILSGKMDSWFYDSPTSILGLHQVEELSHFFEAAKDFDDADPIAKHVNVLMAKPGAPLSKLVSSSLRRAVTTVVAGFNERLRRRPREKILVLPCLQEISRNPDTLSITPSQTNIQASWIDKGSSLCDFQSAFMKQVDMSLHVGNKPVGTNGLRRMREFCEFVFSSSTKEECVIVGGHSIWFRSFFRTFLPYKEDHIGKLKKVVNCGIVGFTLMKVARESGQNTYMIDPQSVDVVYGGFH